MIEKLTSRERYPRFLTSLLASVALGLSGCSNEINAQSTHTSASSSEKVTSPRELAVGDRVDSLPFITLKADTSSHHTLETQDTTQDTGIIYTPFNSRDRLTKNERKNPHLHTATLLSRHGEKVHEKLIVFDKKSQNVTYTSKPRTLNPEDTVLAHETLDGKLQYEIRLAVTDRQVTITYRTDK